MNAKMTKSCLLAVANMFEEKKEELSSYDAVIGDGDHGITMARGAKAARIKLVEMEESTCRDYFKTYGRILVSTLGGAMGPLFGSIFLELSKAVKGKEVVDAKSFALGFENAMNKVMELGGAKPGDKTMVDAMAMAVGAMNEAVTAGDSLVETLEKGAKGAKEGMEATIPMIANRGRSRYAQEKAIGHQDAGATSIAYLLETLTTALKEEISHE
jgi:dihydroxyacetone kinase-like protein